MSRALVCQGVLTVLYLFAFQSFAENTSAFEELYRSPIEGAGGFETVVGVIQRDGASESARHSHPNGEYGVILEGEVTIQSEGEATVTLVKGDTFSQPPNRWHIVSTGNAPSKTVVFRVVGQHQPMIVPVP